MRAVDIVDQIDHNDLNECETEILVKAVARIRELRRKKFDRNMSRAARIVASWPQWKRDCLGVLRNG